MTTSRKSFLSLIHFLPKLSMHVIFPTKALHARNISYQTLYARNLSYQSSVCT